MKVQMITIYAGPRGTIAAGDVAEFPEAEARALIDGKHAVEYAAPPKAEETATALPGGKAMLTPAEENRLAHAEAQKANGNKSGKKSAKAPRAERAERA